ncbi:MAG: class III poly(R)-hydroxyalkanoic acid synthase subunit PhaE, partial [Pseudoxanthomonas suwonensis]|nr:class III poly(R)-hydroxyalkanoic acid synthase subunit PhaE [Pseudoxanthomonas suwonensis]
MFNVPFGQPGPGQPLDVQSFVQQYWNAWGDAMRRAAEGPGAPMPGAHAWSDALNLWSQLAHGGRSEADQALDRFNRQAREWLVQMQQVATQFAGQSAGAREIVDAWRKALGTSSENPFPEMFRAMGAQAMPGLGQWVDDASPYLDSMRRELHANLSLPTFGLAREHQERLQALARAQLDHQERSAAFHALLARSGQRAFERFEDKLAEHEEPGRQIGSARALFDLWVDAAEDAYAETALTAEFREVYGALVNAQMRLRQGIQREVELFCEQFGIPGRTEVDSAHRKIAELQRELRRMRRSDEERPLRRRATPQPSNDATQAAGPTRAHTSGTPSESLQGTAARKSRKNQAAALPVTSGKKTAKQKKAARKAAKAAGENVAGGAAKKPAKKAAK